MTERRVIPYGRQDIQQTDIDAVVDVLKSDYLTQGPQIEKFERAFAEYVGSQYAISVSNGTAALHLCVLSLGLEQGDKVITSTITFAATANCVRYCGGEVVFADIDPDTYLLDFDSVRELIENSPPNTFKGIIPVNFAGRAIEMDKFRSLADEHDIWIIEDACHAPGGYFVDSGGDQRKCGSGDFADLAIFSFHPVKHIASGEGGMITTNDVDLYGKLTRLRTHGITREQDSFENSATLATGVDVGDDTNYPLWYMEMQDLGFNYRLTDFQSALGLSQLSRANPGLERRRRLAEVYFQALCDKPFVKNQSGVVDGHAYHLYVVEFLDRLGLYNYLRSKRIYTQVHYIPVHIMPYYQKQGSKHGDLPIAESYYQNCLSLPMYPTLSDEDQIYVINSIFEFFNHG